MCTHIYVCVHVYVCVYIYIMCVYVCVCQLEVGAKDVPSKWLPEKSLNLNTPTHAGVKFLCMYPETSMSFLFTMLPLQTASLVHEWATRSHSPAPAFPCAPLITSTLQPHFSPLICEKSQLRAMTLAAFRPSTAWKQGRQANGQGFFRWARWLRTTVQALRRGGRRIVLSWRLTYSITWDLVSKSPSKSEDSPSTYV